MTTFPNLTAADLRRAADIKDEIETLHAQLAATLSGNRVGNGGMPMVKAVHWTQTPAGRAKRARLQRATWKARGTSSKGRGKATGRKTVADCILQSLGKGETMSIKKIIIRASQIRGRAISRGLLAFTLGQLKREKMVSNPERGQYRKT